MITALSLVGAFAGGFALWILFEYLLHRFAMHDLKGKGMQINQLSPAEANRMREKLAAVNTGIATNVGEDMDDPGPHVNYRYALLHSYAPQALVFDRYPG